MQDGGDAVKNKVNIRIGNNSVPISMIFLDVLSAVKIGVKYGPNTKKPIAALIREMMDGEEKINTQVVHQKILLCVLPKTKRDIVLSVDA